MNVLAAYLTDTLRLTNLPLLEFLLLGSVLFQKIFKYLLETICICLELWQDILYSPLDEDAVDHAETLAVTWQWFECFEHKS